MPKNCEEYGKPDDYCEHCSTCHACLDEVLLKSSKKTLLPEFEITDFELGGKKIVRAQGVAEAMLEYLPWPTLDISISYSPSNGLSTVIDKQTDFKYELKLL